MLPASLRAVDFLTTTSRLGKILDSSCFLVELLLARLQQLARVKRVRIRARHPDLIIPKRRPA
jgi:hypothetical protein